MPRPTGQGKLGLDGPKARVNSCNRTALLLSLLSHLGPDSIKCLFDIGFLRTHVMATPLHHGKC